MLAAFGSLDMTAAHATRGGSGAPRLLGALLHPPRRTVNLRHLALFAWRTILPTCPRQTSNLKRPRGVLDARPAITACDTPCAVAAMLRCSADSSAVHSAEEIGWSSYVTDGGLTMYWRPVLAIFGSTLPHRPALSGGGWPALRACYTMHDTFWRCVPLTHYVSRAACCTKPSLGGGFAPRCSVACVFNTF